jgi:hypothetical protein
LDQKKTNNSYNFKQNKYFMKFKLLLLVLSVVFIGSCSAQSILKPLPKYVAPSRLDKIVIIDTLPVPITHDSTLAGFRLSGPMILYALPNSTVFTGMGIDYEHDTYKTATGRWYCDWAIAVGAYAGGQFAPTGVSGVTAVGLSVSFLNKFLTVGVLYNVTNKTFQGAIGPSANLIPQN